MAKFDIREHMEVLGSDGQHVGTVDHLEGADKIKLTKHDAGDGKHHYIGTRRPCGFQRPSRETCEGRASQLAGGCLAALAGCGAKGPASGRAFCWAQVLQSIRREGSGIQIKLP
jgi:hypothetical protein